MSAARCRVCGVELVRERELTGWLDLAGNDVGDDGHAHEPEELVELTLDAWARAEEGRRRGMALVELNAGEPWRDYARRWVTEYLRTHAELVGPNLWAAGLEEPHNLRALGPVLGWAARRGLMERTGRTAPSVRSHLSPAWVWRSLIYGREDVTPPE